MNKRMKLVPYSNKEAGFQYATPSLPKEVKIQQLHCTLNKHMYAMQTYFFIWMLTLIISFIAPVITFT